MGKMSARFPAAKSPPPIENIPSVGIENPCKKHP